MIKEKDMFELKRVQLVSLRCVMGILLLTASSARLTAQQGWNAAVQSTSGPVTPSSSYAVVDAKQFAGSDLCAMINSVFLSYYPGTPATIPGTAKGVVIDARGVSNLICSAVNPWGNLINAETNNVSTAFSNIVLLPAGTIKIQQTWILPPYTHLIGQGPNSTVIAAASGFGSDMIDMGHETPTTNYPCFALKNGNNTWDCPGIVIEHLGRL
jgi:hypothetical protein